jgi:hypothetical protein
LVERSVVGADFEPAATQRWITGLARQPGVNGS